MPKPFPYDTSEGALLRPAKDTVFFDQWKSEDYGNHDLLCAEMSRLAYASRGAVENALRAARFSLAAYIGGDSPEERVKTEGTQAFVATSQEQGLTVLAFRGTESKSVEDLLTDLLASQVSSRPGCRIHAGFASRYGKVATDVAKALNGSERSLLFTGHSLGAALATLAAVDVPSAKLITFGSPRVGDPVFCRLLTGRNVRRFVDCCDVVARVPPTRFDEPTVLKLLQEVGDFDHHGSVVSPLAHVALKAVASAVVLGFAFDPSIEYAHVSSPIYIRADGTITEHLSEGEIADDQKVARDHYPHRMPGLHMTTSSLPSLHGAKPADLFRDFFKRLMGAGQLAQVPCRDLADHAPINYLSAFTGRKTG